MKKYISYCLRLLFTFTGDVDDEIGHSYYLCDEYELAIYLEQNRYLHQHCRNKFPDYCKTETNCKGSFPPYRDYSGIREISSVCIEDITYCVMGTISGSECGYDRTGGYTAVGGFS